MAGQIASVRVYFLIKKKKINTVSHTTQAGLKLYSQGEHLILLLSP